MIKIITTAIAILFFSLSGCNTIPGNCRTRNEFAYIGIDGNVYRYNLCEKESLQLTSDAAVSLSDSAVLAGAYSLTEKAWAPQGNYILARFRGLGNSVFLLNVKDSTKFSFGELEFAGWSPKGNYLVLVQSGNSGHEGNDEDIYVFDMRSAEQIYHDPGRAPYWSDDDSLLFLQAKQSEVVGNQVQELLRRDFTNDGSGKSTPLPLKVESTNPPHLYANQISLSSDDKWAALFVPGIVELSEIRLFNFETGKFLTEGTLPLPDGTFVTRNWTTNSDFGWSPTHPVLAFCNGGGGADDAYNALYGGALFLVNEGNVIPVTESKCGRTQISWNTNGDKLAYLNSSGGISIVDFMGRLIFNSSHIDTNNSNALSAQAGPWWSPDGTWMAIVAESRICVAPVGEQKISELKFECVTDGTMMAWKP